MDSEKDNAFSDIATKTFEEALKELELIIKQLEEGQFHLDQAIVSYERAIALKNHCSQKLQQAKAKIEQVIVDKDDKDNSR